MGYVYEDEENEIEEIIEMPKKSKKKKKKTKEEFIVDNLMTSPEEEKSKETSVDSSYTIDNLLDSEESNDIYLKDLLNKKDMKLFDAYLGTNSKKITDKNFNWGAFFFGGAYLIYRKVYGIGSFILVLCLAVMILFPIANIEWWITALFELLAYLGCGVFANQIILNNVASKILNLKMEKRENIKPTLIKIGGTNILFFFIAVLISSGIYSVYLYKNMETILASFKQEPIYIKYDGRINANESINIRTLLDVEVPEGYKTGHAESYQYSFIFKEDANIAIDIVAASRYESLKTLISDIAEYEGLSEDAINELPLSNTTWYYVTTDVSFYAVGTINNTVYFIRQMHRGNPLAYIDYPTFLESIKETKEETTE